MKILYLTQYAVDGQFQSQFFNYSKDIHKDFEVKVRYIFPYEQNNTLIKAYQNNSVDINTLNFTGARISIGNLLKFITYLRNNDFNIVHSQHPIAGFYNKVGTRLVNLIYRKNIKIIVEQRCVKNNLSFFAQVLESITHPLADLVMCSSDSVELSYFNKVNYHNNYLDGSNISHFTFYNSINTDSFNLTLQKQVGDLSKKELIKLCTIGRNEPVKQPLLIIQAIEKLPIKNVKLYLAGTGSLNEELKQYVSQNNLSDRIEFLGNIDYVDKLLIDCDIFINYSKHEGLCKSLLEAMASGTPVLASDVEGNREVLGLNNEYGFLVKDKSPDELAGAIMKLVNNYDLLKLYSRLGKERIKMFDTKHQIKQVEYIYRKLIYGS